MKDEDQEIETEDTEDTGLDDQDTEETDDGEDADGGEDVDSEDDDGSDGDGEDDGDGDDEGEGKTRSEKRIRKLLGRAKDAEKRVKELEGELEEARKAGGADAETYVAAAREAGVLPGMLSKDLAGAIGRKAENAMLIARYEDWLDDEDNEEYQVGDQNAQLERRWGGEEEKLRKQVKEIFDLGKAALKAGWKPGKKAAKPADGAAPKKKTTKDRPESEKEKPRAKGRTSWADADSERSLTSLIEADMKKRKGD